MTKVTIDINADLGEGLNNEAELMPYLSSCSIACGGHTGDEDTMRKVIRLAKQHKVKIGAHPSFPDKINFGRKVIPMTESELFNSLKQQLITFENLLRSENSEIHHIKPHGALYNLAAKDEKTARVILQLMKEMYSSIKLYAPYKSVIADLAIKANIKVEYEAFADRNYNEDLSLVSRLKPNAILHKKNKVLEHILAMIKQQKVMVENGVEVMIKASTFCVHSDTKNALEILRFLNEELPKNNIKIQ